jgi:hypothetical protein
LVSATEVSILSYEGYWKTKVQSKQKYSYTTYSKLQ